MSLKCAGTETDLVRSATFPAADLQTGNEVAVQRHMATVCLGAREGALLQITLKELFYYTNQIQFEEYKL